MGESKEYDLESEESETNEMDHIKNPESLKIIDSQNKKENYDPFDTYIELEKNVGELH